MAYPGKFKLKLTLSGMFNLPYGEAGRRNSPTSSSLLEILDLTSCLLIQC
jgi:hypothetical protein